MIALVYNNVKKRFAGGGIMAGKIIAINVRLSQEAAEGLKALSDINGVTVSDYVRALVAADLEKNKEFLDDYQRKLQELRGKMKKG